MTVSRKNVDGIWVVAHTIDVDMDKFEDTIDNARDHLWLIKEKAKALGMVGEGLLGNGIEYTRYKDVSSVYMTYYFDRVETDVERGDREAHEKFLKAKAAEKKKDAKKKAEAKVDPEYVEYERLKKKFGG